MEARSEGCFFFFPISIVRGLEGFNCIYIAPAFQTGAKRMELQLENFTIYSLRLH